jgi:hypothetical protein
MRQRSSISAPVSMVMVVLWLAASSGCSGPTDGPRNRIGALPFPGIFTLYHPADPDNLGRHRYDRAPRFFQPDEAERGIVYTVRGGFLDLAHVRVTIDSVRYCTAHVRAAMRERRDTVILRSNEGSVFIVSLRRLPATTDGSSSGVGAGAEALAEAEARVADELAIRTGQRLAYLMMTWHEIVTWFGHRKVMFIDESPSSFTYDDPMSHVVGLRVAGRALRERRSGSWRSFDEAVTVALREELAELGAVSPGRTGRAVRAVEGVWWSRGRPLKRQIDVGLSDGAVRPWLVPDLPFAPDPGPPEPFSLPTLTDVLGRDCSDFYSVRIDPNIPEGDRMRALLPTRPRLFSADRDVPLLIEAARRQMRRRLAADVDQPWPMPMATTRPGVEPPQRISLAPSGGSK